MQFVIVLLIAAAVFGVCYLVDKGFSKAFRGKAQHRSGMAVRANKRFGVFGVVLTVLGVMAFCIGIGDGPVLIVGGLIVFAMGVFLAVYYLSFGIFYDVESFLMSRFGKKDAVHRYEEIVGQKLYVVQGGSIVAELYLKDGSTVSLQSTMDGVYPFLDTTFAGWCLQTGRDPERCDFPDPSKSLSFPPEENRRSRTNPAERHRSLSWSPSGRRWKPPTPPATNTISKSGSTLPIFTRNTVTYWGRGGKSR